MKPVYLLYEIGNKEIIISVSEPPSEKSKSTRPRLSALIPTTSIPREVAREISDFIKKGTGIEPTSKHANQRIYNSDNQKKIFFQFNEYIGRQVLVSEKRR